MWTKVKTALSSISSSAWGYILAGVTLVVLLFKQKKFSETETKLEVADADKKDAVLASQEQDVQKEEKQVEQDADAQKKEKLTNEELAKQLNKI